MRLPYLLMAGWVAVSAPAFLHAQATYSGSTKQAQQELIQIERDIGRANLECDYNYFRKIEADEFIFTNAAGAVTTKSQDLAGEKDCHKFNGTYDLDETEVRVYGNTAVVTGRVTIQGVGRDGKPVHHLSRFTDVFVWKDGGWQIVAGHSSRLPPPS